MGIITTCCFSQWMSWSIESTKSRSVQSTKSNGPFRESPLSPVLLQGDISLRNSFQFETEVRKRRLDFFLVLICDLEFFLVLIRDLDFLRLTSGLRWGCVNFIFVGGFESLKNLKCFGIFLNFFFPILYFSCLGLPKVKLHTICPFIINAHASQAIRSYINSKLQAG